MQHSTPVRRRGFAAHHAALGAVTLALGGALAYTGIESLTPLETVRVSPVVPVNTAQSTSDDQPTQHADNTPTGPTIAVQAPGWLEADPFLTAATALAGGVVHEILVLEGESVVEGQPVARLVDDDAKLALAHAEAALEAARARVESARARLTAAQQSWEEPVERVRAVATTRAHADEFIAQLAQLPTMIEREEAIEEKRREEYERAKRAFESGAASETELIIATQDLEAQRAAVRTLRLQEPIIKAKLSELEAEHAAAVRNAELRIEEREALDAATAELNGAEAEAELAAVARDTAALRLERMTVYAPISGFVQRRLKVPGDKAMLDMDDQHSAHIVHLYDPAKLQVRVDVPLAEAANIAVGQPCEVVVDVLPDVTFEGIVTRITHEADLQKNTLQAKVRVIDPSPMLRPEMLTRVRFLPTRTTHNAAPENTNASGEFHIAADALPSDTPGPTTIWTVRNRRATTGDASRVPVTLHAVQDDMARISGDLKPTDLVITNPHELSSGQRVRIEQTGGDR